MGLTHLRLQKIYNLFQDPFERADFTSNTYWDWVVNQVGGIYGVMQEVFDFAATFKEFQPRSFPPSFVPSMILEEILGHIRQGRQEEAEAAASKRGPFAWPPSH